MVRLDAEQQRLIAGMQLERNVARVTVLNVPDRPGMSAVLFAGLGRGRVNCDLIIQAGSPGSRATDVSFTTSKEELPRALAVAQDFAARTETTLAYDDDLAKVSIIGSGLASNYGVAAEMFQALGDAGINIELITGSEIKISCLVRSAQAAEAVRVIFHRFNLGGNGVDLHAILAGGTGS